MHLTACARLCRAASVYGGPSHSHFGDSAPCSSLTQTMFWPFTHTHTMHYLYLQLTSSIFILSDLTLSTFVNADLTLVKFEESASEIYARDAPEMRPRCARDAPFDMHQCCPPRVITGNLGCISIDATAFDGPHSSAAEVTCQRPDTYFQAHDTSVSDNLGVRPRRRGCPQGCRCRSHGPPGAWIHHLSRPMAPHRWHRRSH